jgi:DNA-binding transcriptional ArsR family regulator
MTSTDPRVNSVGDLILTDPEAMRALAHPIRLALLDRLQLEGPATAAELADELEVTAPPIREHLQELETFGLVRQTEEDDSWSAATKGLVFEIPDNPEGQEVARQLSNMMLLRSADLPGQWAAEDEPRLGPDWVRASGLINSRVTLTTDELRGLQEGLEQLLEPFITREAEDIPFGASRVRILSYFLPEAAE